MGEYPAWFLGSELGDEDCRRIYDFWVGKNCMEQAERIVELEDALAVIANGMRKLIGDE